MVLSRVSISVRHFSFIFGVLASGLLLMNLVWSCVATFDCSVFWPTASYMACYRGHDRLFNFTLTLCAVMLLVYFAICTAHFTKSAGYCKKGLYMGLGVCISIVLPPIAVIDEANSSHFVPLEYIHMVLSGSLCTFSVAWIALTLWFLTTQCAAGPYRGFIWRYTLLGFVALAGTVYMWYYSFTPYSLWWTNHNVEAVLEWTTILMAVWLPFVYSLELPEASISIDTLRTAQRE